MSKQMTRHSKDIQGSWSRSASEPKRGQMNRIGGAIVLGFVLLAASTTAWAQELTTGRVTGRVTDTDTGAPMGGVTVIAQGPQGEDATLTDDKGHYQFSGLSVGTYVLRFYAANNPTQVEQPGVTVAADKMVRVNVKIASSAQAATQQTYVITGQAPVIDIGSAHIGATFFPEFTLNVPVEPNVGDVIVKAPGAFVDGSGNVSIGGATGLENIYLVNGLNVTGLRYGSLNTSSPSSIGGGTNLPTEFFQQIDVNAGGYSAEFGGAMGGVINTVLKSGSNEFHGSVFASWAPYWLSGSPSVVTTVGSSIGGVRKPDFDDRVCFELGGPLIKDMLFFWVGFAPELNATHAFRYTYALQAQRHGHGGHQQAGDFPAAGYPARQRDAPDLLLRRDRQLHPADQPQARAVDLRDPELQQPGPQRAGPRVRRRLPRERLDDQYPGGPHEDEHRPLGALDVEVLRSALAARGHRRPAQRVLL